MRCTVMEKWNVGRLNGGQQKAMTTENHAVAASGTTASTANSPSHPGIRSAVATVWQVLLLSCIWLAAEALRSRMGWGIPAGLIGFAALALGLFTRIVPVRWLARGTHWLMADMLLFFIPAMLVVVNYGDLVRSQGLRILLVIVLSTICVMAVTALVVDAVYKLELRLAQNRRGGSRSKQRTATGAHAGSKAVL